MVHHLPTPIYVTHRPTAIEQQLQFKFLRRGGGKVTLLTEKYDRGDDRTPCNARYKSGNKHQISP